MQALRGVSLGGKFGFEVLRHAFEAELTHIPQNSVLAREIAEESRLADFENFDNIIDASFLVTLFAEQTDGGLDNLLAQPRLLALTQPRNLLDLRCSLWLDHIPVLPMSLRCGRLNSSHIRILSYTRLQEVVANNN